MSVRNKGSRIVDLISDYVVIDLETTSRNINYAEIIEIGAIKVVNNKPVKTFSTMLKPVFDIPASATAINGITNEMVKDAPSIKDVIRPFLSFVGNSVLMGHNIASYDINILFDYVKELTGEDFRNPYVDTLYLARNCLGNLCNHKLGTIAEYYGLDTNGEHRALYDCFLTHGCYQLMKELCIKQEISLVETGKQTAKNAARRVLYSKETQALQMLQGFLMGITADGVLTESEILSLKGWMDNNQELMGNYPFDVVMKSLDNVLEDGIIGVEEREELLKLYQKFTAPVENADHETICTLEGVHCCVTGDFKYGERKSVLCYITEHGGICDANVKKSTDYVIVGSKGSDVWKHGNYGGKIQRAMEFKEKGVNISIISEEDFFKEVESE